MGIEVVHGTRGTKGSTEMWYRVWYRNTHTHYYSYITTYFLFFYCNRFFYRTNVYWIVITGGGHRQISHVVYGIKIVAFKFHRFL